MKRTRITTIVLSIIAVIILWCMLSSLHILKRTNEYVVVNDNGLSLPAVIYKRTSLYNKKQLILYFSDTTLKHDRVLMIGLDDKDIGSPEGGISDFYRIGDNFLVQQGKDAYIYTSYTSMPYEDYPLISVYKISDSLITFGTFDKLKKFGYNIIIKNLIN